MGFPPRSGFGGGGGAGAPMPPRKTLNTLRRSVGTVPDPATAVAPKDSCTVSMACPNCGAPIDKTFSSEPAADDQGGGAPPVADSGSMQGGGGY